MSPSAPQRGSAHGRGLRIAVLRSRFTEDVTGRLLEGALQALREHGVPEPAIRVVEVPGAVELPLAAERLARAGGCDAIVCLGAVIRGETGHYEHVCRMAADGVLRVMLDTRVPVSFGVLTCEDHDQALARSAPGRNKGYDAALVAIEMANLARDLGGPDR